MSSVRRSAQQGGWVPIAVACLLVVQALFAGLASGAHAASMSLDRTLALTLCAPGEAPGGTAADTGSAGHDLTICCVLGCAPSGGGEAPAAAGFAPVVHRAIDLIAFARRLDAPHGYVAGRSPANPRAPPAAV